MKCKKCQAKALKIAFLKDGTILYHHMIFLSQLDHQIPYWSWRQRNFNIVWSSQLFFGYNVLGVISVAIKGEKKNRIEVIGEGIVDAAGLAETLRKKVGFADLVSVEEVEEKSWRALV